MSHATRSIVAWILPVTILLAAASMAPPSAYAQSADCRDMLVVPERVTLKDINLDVMLGIDYAKDQSAKFMVSFFDSTTNAIQNHVDYNLIIRDSTDKEIFNAASSVSVQQAALHTAEGVATIPYSFTDNGFHTIIVSVSGINFIPMEPQVAQFPCVPSPEFPTGLVGGLAAIMTVMMLAAIRYKKLGN